MQQLQTSALNLQRNKMTCNVAQFKELLVNYNIQEPSTNHEAKAWTYAVMCSTTSAFICSIKLFISILLIHVKQIEHSFETGCL